MKTREKSIELLNRAVADELTAVHQYMYFHFDCDDYGYDPLSELFRRTEELTALWLDVPLTAKLCAALKARGITIDCDFTTEDFADKVLAYAASHPKKEGDA